MNEWTTPEESSHQPASREEGLLLCLRLILTAGVVISGCLAEFSVTLLPRFERIFDDMLGSLDKLPTLTKAMLAWGRMMPVPSLAVFVLFAGGMVMIWRSRQYSAVVFGVTAVLLLSAHWLIANVACLLPLMTIIQSMSESRGR